MTRILTIIALLYSSPVAAGEVDGNSFYCKPKYEDFGHLAIKFAEGKALIQNKYVLKKAQEYSTTAKNVFVPEPWSVTYQLNRKTLRLRHLSEGRAFGEWNCEFMEFNKARNIVRAENKLLKSKEREGNRF